jgi:hypothetical protein
MVEVVKVTFSQDALDYIKKQKRISRLNLVIYRDIGKIGGCGSRAFYFVPKVKVIDKEPDSAYFTIIGNDKNAAGIPLWVERALVSTITESGNINVTLKKGLLLKTLKLELGTGEKEISSSSDTSNSSHTNATEN